MSEAELLDRFGKTLMSSVRDETLDYYAMLADGLMKAPTDVQLSERMKSLGANERELLKEAVTVVLDNSLHNLLSMFEFEEDVNLVAKDEENNRVNLNEISDGLAGELYSEEGWIAKFSSHKTYLE